MGNIFNNELLQSSFNIAYKENWLQSNYFVHKLKSPYDTNNIVQNDKKELFEKINSNIDKLKAENNAQEWKVRKIKQEALMRAILNNNTLSGIDLIRQFNQAYLNYLKESTVLFDENGYYNIYVQEVLRKELVLFYKSIDDNYKSYQFTQQVSGSLIEFFEKEKLKKTSIDYFTNRIATLKKNIKNLEEKEKLLKYERMDYYDNLSRLEACQRFSNILSHNEKFIIENIFIDAGRKHKNKLSGQEAGRESEKLFEEFAGDFIQKQLGNITIKQTGAGQMRIEASESLSQQSEVYTIKTDVELELDSSIINKTLNQVEIDIINKIKEDNSFKKDKIKFNFSLKNYKTDTNFDISAQSNNNITSFLNILIKNTKNRNTLSFLKDKHNIENLQYFILNDLVDHRSQKTIEEFKNQCKEIGINVLLALDSESDEVDFLVFNQRLIPSYYLLESIEKERKRLENSAYNLFSIHMKKVQPVAVIDKKRSDKTNFLKGYYSKNYLESHKEYGEKIYNSIYINTKIDKKFILNIIKEITEKVN